MKPLYGLEMKQGNRESPAALCACRYIIEPAKSGLQHPGA